MGMRQVIMWGKELKAAKTWNSLLGFSSDSVKKSSNCAQRGACTIGPKKERKNDWKKHRGIKW